MDVNYRHIGRRIREERTRAGLSQAKLAELADSSMQYISLIETAKKKASLEMLIRIADALDVSVDRFLADSLPDGQYRCDGELSRLMDDCSGYERQVIMDVAWAARKSLADHRWMISTDKS